MSLWRSLLEKPWVAGAAGQSAMGAEAASVPQKVALMFFLGIVGVLFALFASAYFVRMELADWRPMPESPLLWFNTAMLLLASVLLQWTRNGLRQGGRARVRRGLLLGGLVTLGFVAGQLVVWRQMAAAGYYLAGNPANSFFYVLTGLHALHIVGGLWVWTASGLRVWSGAALDAVRLSVELCTLYWHFLLLVWLVLFALLANT